VGMGNLKGAKAESPARSAALGKKREMFGISKTATKEERKGKEEKVGNVLEDVIGQRTESINRVGVPCPRMVRAMRM